jgi:hypothetical protein
LRPRPIATADRIYFPDEEGVTIVIAPGDEYREIAQNDLGEMTLASPAVAGNSLFIRTAQEAIPDSVVTPAAA